MSETGSEEYRARRATHKFLQQGMPTRHTMIFSELPQRVQVDLTKRCHKGQEHDLPVVVCYLDADNWCLLTTRRVHWCHQGNYKNRLYSEIKQVGWSAGPGKKRSFVGQVDWWISTEEGRVRTKTDSPWFFIFDKNEERHELRLEVGSAQEAIWDAIEMLIRLEQIHPRKDEQCQTGQCQDGQTRTEVGASRES